MTPETDVQVPFAEAFDFCQGQLIDRFPNRIWPWTEMFSSSGRKMRESVRILDAFAYKIIDSREKIEVGAEKSEEKKDLLALLMGIRYA